MKIRDCILILLIIIVLSNKNLFALSPGKYFSAFDSGDKITSVYLDFNKTDLNNGLKIKYNPSLVDWGIAVTDNLLVRISGGVSEINLSNGFNGNAGFFYSLGTRWNFLSLENDIQAGISVDVVRGESKGFGIIDGLKVEDSEWTQWQTALYAFRTFYDKVTFYGGGKYSDGELKIAGLNDGSSDNNFGAFVGIDLRLTKRWLLNGEFRLFDENVFSFGFSTKY